MRRRDLLGLLLSLPLLRRWGPPVVVPPIPDAVFRPDPVKWLQLPSGYKLYVTDSPSYSFGFTGFTEADRQTYCPEVSMAEIERDIAETGEWPRAKRQ